ncbi:TIR domain-containing protein [Xylanimonas protaetiae]|uniref:Molecular chaperone Tir n=1 Tax=Xylanimonas protaetiae TaxID=2509457 RepID=A0A4P6F2H3_9MICO|nr:TIR domain-containing protein [Xylanimonas protaetiae]QAY69752.1 molecular chaperone Tir [Xylanimonas protaetiae]
MGHKVYISFKTEDESYKRAIQAMPHLDFVDKSLDEPINSLDPDYIMRRIRELYLHDSTVTIFLIGAHSAENLGAWEQQYIKRELQASLWDSSISRKSGLLGIVLPEVHDRVFRGTIQCVVCDNSHNIVRVDDSTTVTEFSYNYYIPNNKCAWAEDDRYCVLTTWAAFDADPNGWIDRAFGKRSAPIANKTKVRP